jgi:spore coat protein A, manganese oxidase
MSHRPFFSRREFLRNSAALAAGLAIPQTNPRKTGVISRPLLDTASLPRFVDALPIPRVIKASGTRPHPDHPKSSIPYYRLPVGQFQTKFHRDMKPTRVWGYAKNFPGPSIEARSGEPILVEWPNELPRSHFLPVDHTIHGAESTIPDVRIVTHLHGGKVAAKDDGYPEAWYPVGKSATYFYPNQQESSMLWYHDHALGITRLNVYAGLFGSYLLRDKFEAGLNLPAGKYEVPLILCDRYFDSDAQLYYPVSPDEKTPWIPEVFGDVIAVNGKLFPFLDVEPRKYRFRLLNASNARFFHIALSNKQEFLQIGSDLGFLSAPVPVKLLTIAPGERADLILDFTGHAGETITAASDSLDVLQFRVSKTKVSDPSSLPSSIRTIQRTPESAAVKTRILTIGEKHDVAGNPETMLLNNAHWSMPVTENPKLDSVEIWSLLNFTDDSHPIHLHMVRFQILDRQNFEPEFYYKGGEIRYIGPVTPPAANELGWKDTVQAHGGTVTRIITKFEGYTGRYVWHCHILEHEDNEMMRPYEIVSA